MHKTSGAALVIAVIALLVSLSGTALAAVIISSNSQVAPHTIAGAKAPAGDNQNLIPGSVGGADLHGGAISSSKLAPQAVVAASVLGGLPCAFSIQATWDNITFQGGACGGVTTMKEISPGIYCFTFPFVDLQHDGGGAVTMDAATPGYPVGYLSFDSSDISATGCPGGSNALVTTFTGAGGSLSSEAFHAVVYDD